MTFSQAFQIEHQRDESLTDIVVKLSGNPALRNLKVLLASASNHDPMVKEAQRFEGGTDATDTESTAISIGTVLSIHSDSPVGSNAIRGETEDDPVTSPIVPPALGESTRPPEGGQP
jgi:hypothetical protein